MTSQAHAVRRFNRFYTEQIGVLDDHILRSPFSLAEARVLFEIAARRRVSPSELVADLRLDAGYLSRILRRLKGQRLVKVAPSAEDRRKHELSLTTAGDKAFAALDTASTAEIKAMLAALGPAQRERLVGAMAAIEQALGARPRGGTVHLRHPRPGDLGWIVQRHGALYWQEYRWDATFEGLVAKICADFAAAHDPARERAFIAEVDGERVGCVLLVRNAEDPRKTAQLRLLLVEPTARGLGVGRKLVRACTTFARAAGYRRITLWTNDVLHAARRLYEREGYALQRQGPHRSFGHDLVEQTWALTL